MIRKFQLYRLRQKNYGQFFYPLTSANTYLPKALMALNDDRTYFLVYDVYAQNKGVLVFATWMELSNVVASNFLSCLQFMSMLE